MGRRIVGQERQGLDRLGPSEQTRRPGPVRAPRLARHGGEGPYVGPMAASAAIPASPRRARISCSMAALQFVGGAWIYWSLRSARACLSCEQYLRERGSRARFFRNADQADDYYSLFDHGVDSEEFARKASLGAPKQIKSPTEMMIQTQLLDCDGCHRQLWIDRPSMFNGKEWRELPELSRETIIPPASNVARFVRGSGLPSWLS